MPASGPPCRRSRRPARRAPGDPDVPPGSAEEGGSTPVLHGAGRRAPVSLLGARFPGGEWRGGVALADGEIALLENVRFNSGEKKNEELARAYASLCDIFVMDAFGTAHRAQASTHGVAIRPVACAGPLLAAELNALEQALSDPARPLVAIVGGPRSPPNSLYWRRCRKKSIS